MNLYKYIKTIIIVLLMIPNSYSQDSEISPRIYSVKELSEDFKFWRIRLEKRSPLLYYYEPKEKVDAYMDSIYALIDHPMTGIEFYRLIVPVRPFLKDVHCGIGINQITIDRIFAHDHVIPFVIAWIDSKAYIRNSDVEKSILIPGTEILSINGINTSDIYKKMIGMMPNDGLSEQYSKHLVNSNFRYSYHIMHGMHKEYSLEYVDGNKKTIQLNVPGLSMDSLDRLKSIDGTPIYRDSIEGIQLQKIEEKNVSVLTVSSFVDGLINKAQGNSFKNVLSNQMSDFDFENEEHLIIDLRGNEGGAMKNVKELLSYLTDKPYVQAIQGRVVKNKDEQDFEKRTKKRWYPWSGIGRLKPKRKNFQGSIYVLVNEGSSSAAPVFAQVLRKYKRATIIGNETGGNPIILNGFILGSRPKMPNTKHKTYSGNYCTIIDDIKLNTGYGLIPDHIIKPRVSDLNTRNDRALEFVFGLIEKD